jgi:hypothetical protein
MSATSRPQQKVGSSRQLRASVPALQLQQLLLALVLGQAVA